MQSATPRRCGLASKEFCGRGLHDALSWIQIAPGSVRRALWERQRSGPSNSTSRDGHASARQPTRAFAAVRHNRHACTRRGVAIRYERVSGDDIALSSNGKISCRERGDAVVRASIADIKSLIDGDGQIVEELRGSARMSNTSVATLRRGLLTRHKVGASRLTISIGARSGRHVASPDFGRKCVGEVDVSRRLGITCRHTRRGLWLLSRRSRCVHSVGPR